MSEKKDDVLIGLFCALIALILLVVIWVAYSYFEASSYNRVTGKDVSTFDAMFLELRVQEGAK